MLGTRGTGARDLRFMVLGVGTNERGFQVVNHDAFGHATKKFKRMLMTQEPGRQGLVEHELDELVAAPGQHHGKDSGTVHRLRRRIDQGAHFTEIHLGDFARGRLEAHEHLRRRARFDFLAQTIHGGFARGEPGTCIQFLKDEARPPPLREPALDFIAIAWDRGLVLWRVAIAEHGAQALVQFAQGRQGVSRDETFLLEPGAVFLDGSTADFHRVGNPAIRFVSTYPP